MVSKIEKKDKIVNMIFLILGLFVVITLIFKFSYNLSLGLSLIISFFTTLIFIIFYKLNKKYHFIKSSKRNKVVEEQLNKLNSNEIRSLVDISRDYIKVGEKIIKKRKDWTTQEKINDTFSTIIGGGTIILLIGLIYLGALPAYFNVNDEFINPTNSSFGYNASIDLLMQQNTSVFLITNRIGKDNPSVWFWMFWVTVFTFMIFPIIKLIYFLIKKQGGKYGS